MKKILLVSAFSSALILSACSSSDDVAQFIADEFVTVSGKTTNLDATPLSDVAIEGVYIEPGGLVNPKDSSKVDGSFALTVIKDDVFYLRATKSTYATINTARVTLSANEAGLELSIPTVIEAQEVITLAFTATQVPLFKDADKAWFVVDVSDANGEVAGALILPLPVPDAWVYTDCDGAVSVNNNQTIASCPNDDRTGPMYIAYYNSPAPEPAEILVTVDGKTQSAPIRLGEITVLEFEQ